MINQVIIHRLQLRVPRYCCDNNHRVIRQPIMITDSLRCIKITLVDCLFRFGRYMSYVYMNQLTIF